VDYLTLHTGKKFVVVFDVLIIFATNLNPNTLADEAFLRRIPYKIYAKNPTVEEFSRIFEMNCRRKQLSFDPVVIEYLQRRFYEPRRLEMRACHPRDIIDQVVDLSRYQGREAAITRCSTRRAATSSTSASAARRARRSRPAARRPRRARCATGGGF
jgi:SpoVK/Ycf46/Vps4 family AAA+-type ATPase